MPTAAHLRVQLEHTLERRVPAAFSPQARLELPTISTGIAAIDALLSGGLPVGTITELVASASSGRTTCAHGLVAEVMRTGQVCAWVDASDAFDPESAAGNGLDLDQLLWVRCGEQPERSSPCIAAKASAGPSDEPRATRPVGGGGSPHPRNEARGLPEALNTFLSQNVGARKPEKIGTPGMPNRSLARNTERVEQVATDRLPPRRGTYLLEQQHCNRSRDAQTQPLKIVPTSASSVTKLSSASAPQPRIAPARKQKKPWSSLDQALRSMDLVMQAGGFGAVVLDLGSIPPEFARRIPLATWFRFRAAAERARTVFLLLTQQACAQSSAEVVLQIKLAAPEPERVMMALPYTVKLVRQRFRNAPSKVVLMRRPPHRATTALWNAPMPWATER